MKTYLSSIFLFFALLNYSPLSASITWDFPFEWSRSTSAFTSDHEGTFTLPNSGGHTFNFDFNNNHNIAQVQIIINNASPATINADDGTVSFTSVVGITNVVKMHIVFTSIDFCHAGNLDIDVDDALGQNLISQNINARCKFNGRQLSVNGTSTSHVTVYNDCINGLHLQCPLYRCNPDYRLIISQLDPTNNFSVISSTQVERLLTGSEKTSLHGSGLLLTSLTGTGGTINLTDDNYYFVTFVDVTSGWDPEYKQVHFKAGTWDLVIKDNDRDYAPFGGTGYGTPFYLKGYEPYDANDNNVFRSVDIWNNLSTTSVTNNKTHEDPDYVSSSGNTNKLRVNIENHGCSTSTANQELRLYWTRARTDELYSRHWIYDMTNNYVVSAIPPYLNVPGGSEITITGAANGVYNTNSSPYYIPAIATAANHHMSWSQAIDWYPPNPADFDASNGSMSTADQRPILCLLARINYHTGSSIFIDEVVYEPTTYTNKILPYVKNNNNVATRNTLLYDNPGFLVSNGSGGDWDYGFGTVIVNNTSSSSRNVSLCVDLLDASGLTETFIDYGRIEVGLTTPLAGLWNSGGASATNFSTLSSTLFQMTDGYHACLNNIVLPANYNLEQIGLRFVFDSTAIPDSAREFAYQISMIDSAEGMNGTNSVIIVGVPAEAPSFPLPSMTTSNRSIRRSAPKTVIYPNPANDLVNIQYNNANEETNFEVNILDNTGKVLYHGAYSSFPGYYTEKINTANWENGVYLVEIITEKEKNVSKFVIIH